MDHKPLVFRRLKPTTDTRMLEDLEYFRQKLAEAMVHRPLQEQARREQATDPSALR